MSLAGYDQWSTGWGTVCFVLPGVGQVCVGQSSSGLVLCYLLPMTWQVTKI